MAVIVLLLVLVLRVVSTLARGALVAGVRTIEAGGASDFGLACHWVAPRSRTIRNYTIDNLHLVWYTSLALRYSSRIVLAVRDVTRAAIMPLQFVEPREV